MNVWCSHLVLINVDAAALKLLEVVPGTTVWDLVVGRDWNGVDVNQIGRQPPLSSNKSATHFPILREITKVSYDRMLFFDDCQVWFKIYQHSFEITHLNLHVHHIIKWGDHCGQVERACKERNGRGPVTVRTPYGLRVDEWNEGLAKYAEVFQEWIYGHKRTTSTMQSKWREKWLFPSNVWFTTDINNHCLHLPTDKQLLEQ